MRFAFWLLVILVLQAFVTVVSFLCVVFEVEVRTLRVQLVQFIEGQHQYNNIKM